MRFGQSCSCLVYGFFKICVEKLEFPMLESSKRRGLGTFCFLLHNKSVDCHILINQKVSLK